ncbi:unnamed protein product [Diatraea saccharalis]|uniref:Uncharacterized protein n=1 Tax=Diatraea saccharalis TaxID=40085 RepID=A0A9P0C897_9NEOP|nr:unnamed protein product [Diatraea saccharalis]
MEGSNDTLSILAPSVGGSSAVLLTPGRTRNIAQDMEALRLSRQDNPYLQQVMASRESLIESQANDCESDDTILMSQEFGSTALDFVEEDPLTLKEVHEHMIRSPPPISCWPHDTVSYRASSAFDFGADSPVSYSAFSVNSQEKVTNITLYLCVVLCIYVLYVSVAYITLFSMDEKHEMFLRKPVGYRDINAFKIR